MSEAAKKARNEYAKKWREENRDKIREYHRKWRNENPDKVAKNTAEYWERQAKVE